MGGGIHYLRQSLPPFPDSQIRALCGELVRGARAKGLGGTVQALEFIKGPEKDLYFDALTPFINAELASGFDRFLFPPSVRRAVVAQVSDLLKKKDWVRGTPDLIERSPDVLLSADWVWVVPQEEVALTLRAVRLSATADGIQVSGRFVHPTVLREEKRFRRNLMWALYGSGLVPLFSLIVFFNKIFSGFVPNAGG